MERHGTDLLPSVFLRLAARRKRTYASVSASLRRCCSGPSPPQPAATTWEAAAVTRDLGRASARQQAGRAPPPRCLMACPACLGGSAPAQPGAFCALYPLPAFHQHLHLLVATQHIYPSAAGMKVLMHCALDEGQTVWMVLVQITRTAGFGELAPVFFYGDGHVMSLSIAAPGLVQTHQHAELLACCCSCMCTRPSAT